MPSASDRWGGGVAAVISAASKPKQQDEVNIDKLQQFVHSCRTEVTSRIHNFRAAWAEIAAEKFGVQWRPTEERVYLLGRRYRAPVAPPEPSAGSAGGSSSSGAGRCSGCGAEGANRHVCMCGDGCASSAEGTCSCCSTATAAPDDQSGTAEEMMAAWLQITRMTYREGFAPMYRCVRRPAAGSDEPHRYIRLTSDAGWGCMIRVGQMLLAAALKRHEALGGSGAAALARRCGAERRGDHGGVDDGSAAEAADVLPPLEQHFLDDPCRERSPFSIFGFVRTAHGREVASPPDDEAAHAGARSRGGGPASPKRGRQLTQKSPGEWFGPTTISETIAALVESTEELREHLAVYVDADGVLYEDEVRQLAAGADETGAEQAPPLDHGAAPTAAARRADDRPAPGGAEGGGAAPALSPPPGDVARGRPREEGVVVPRAAYEAAKCGTMDSDDDFMVIRTPSIIASPTLCPHTPPMNAGDSPLMVAMESCEFDESQADFEMRLLPPAGCDFDDASGWEGGMIWASLDGEGDVPKCGAGRGDSDMRGALSEAGEAPGGAAGGGAPGSRTETRWERPVLLLFPVQLGLGKYASPSSISSLLRYFELRSSLGAMGGRPRQAHFFVGRQGRGLLYVDPHVVQPAALDASLPTPAASAAEPPAASQALGGDSGAGAEEEPPTSAHESGAGSGCVGASPGGATCNAGAAGLESFANTPTVTIIPAEHIDSSISFAFYLRSEEDFQELLAGLKQIELAEANAPIRAEATRPQALRLLQALSSFQSPSSMSLPEMQPEGSEEASPASSPSSQHRLENPQHGLTEPTGGGSPDEEFCDDACDDGCCSAEDSQWGLGDVAANRRKMDCSSWAGGSWAEVHEVQVGSCVF